jgi:hypothetical protein
MKIQLLTALSLVSAPALAAESIEGLTPVTSNLPGVERRGLVPVASNLPGALGGGTVKSASGSSNGLSWTARSTIIGQSPTSDSAPAGPGVPPNPPINSIGGGNAIYKPAANKDGTVALIMEYSNGGRFICSGSVINGGRSIATAAHCVSSGGGVKDADLVKTTAYFYNGDPDQRTVDPATGSVAIEVKHYFVNPDYTGEVIDQNDIAILRLETPAPAWADVYDLYTSDIKGKQFNVAGYGTRSTVGGATGNSAPTGARTGYLREGDNIYDYAWGDAVFNGFFTDIIAGENFFGTADIEFSYISDFDNGLFAQDSSRRIANALGLGPIGNQFFFNPGIDSAGTNTLGDLSAREVGIAGGDSGGPGFVDGKLASINSYGLTFGFNFGDFDPNVIVDGQSRAVFNAGWGEFSGYVPVFIHTDWISSVVPEPGSWAMMIAGFGLVGGTMRRQRKVAATA